MGEFNSVSILLPTLNETFSFIETVKIILEECDKKDLHEFIAIVCERTEKESLKSRRCGAGRHGSGNRQSYYYDGTGS